MQRSSAYDAGSPVSALASTFRRSLTAAALIVSLFCIPAMGQNGSSSNENNSDSLSPVQIPSSINPGLSGVLSRLRQTGAQQVTGAQPQLTQAEKVQQSEQQFQGTLAQIKDAVSSLDARIMDMRKDAAPPPAEDLNRVNQDLDIVDNELRSLAALAISPLAEVQRSDVQDKVFKLRMETEILKQRWADETPVFGMDFFSNSARLPETAPQPVPRNYRVRVGDKLCVLVTSSIGEQNDYHLTVDPRGAIQLPAFGRFTVAGSSVAAIERVIKAKVASRFKQLQVHVTVEDLTSIRVQVTGAVARPGTYVLSGMATVTSALYQAGGPTKAGTFRHIALERDGEPRRNIDLYDFLLNGAKKQDAMLEDGDLLFVPPVGPTFSIGGEVIRPGRFEADFPLTLSAALKLAGGAKPTGYTQTIQVERVQNGEYKALLAEPMNGANGKTTFHLQPGDEVNVTSISPDRTNEVSIAGLVRSPGIYGYSDKMRVADLIKLAQGVSQDKEVYGGRADILRINSLKGTEIVSFNLDKALELDPEQNVPLHKLDRVFIYSPDQVVFRPMLITVAGSVAKPGIYKRTPGMRVSDAIAAAGGVLPQAHLQRADLVRRSESDASILEKVNLQAALNGDPTANIELKDRDELTISSDSDVSWHDRSVRIEGAVQRPGTYERSENMRVSDLLFMAGGLLPEAGDTGELARSTGAATEVTRVALQAGNAAKDPDILLKDRDVLTVPAINSYLRTPPVVYLTGEVARPGPYALSDNNEKLSDIIKRAGGLTNDADLHGMLFLRQKDSFENAQQQHDADLILATARIFAGKEYLVELAKLGMNVPPQLQQLIAPSGQQVQPGEVVPDERLEHADGVAGQNQGQQQAQSQGQQQSPQQNQPQVPNNSGYKTLVMPQPVNANINNTSAVNSGASGTLPANNSGSSLANVLGALSSGASDNSQTVEPSAMGAAVADLQLPANTPTNVDLAPLMSSARISVDLSKAVKDPNSPDNIIMRSGDRVFIPKQTDVVTVIGSVMHPHSFAAGPGRTADYYIERSGGYARDAATSQVIVVRANGDALPKASVKSVEPGDMIVVPNTGLVETAKKWERVAPVTKVISDILSSVYMLTKL